MSNTLSNTYFFKAMDKYPYELEQTIENLNYAHSYDENNADVNWLMGQFHMNELMDYETAQFHFETALASNIDHIKSHYSLIWLCISTDEFEKAIKLIEFAESVKGIKKTYLHLYSAYIFEKQGNFKQAKKLLKKAIATTICLNDLNFYKQIMSSLNYKMKLDKPKKKKKKKKGKKKKK